MRVLWSFSSPSIRRRSDSLSLMGMCLVMSQVALAQITGPPTGLFLNEDNSHFFGSRTAEDMTLEGLHAFVDQYAGTKVSHLVLNPSAMRTSYKSDVWDAIWELGTQKVPAGNEFAAKWVANARLLHERGLDPYAVWIARCREKGISPWLSMRMNDLHDVDDTTNFMHSTFWLEHPEYWRVPGSTSGWTDRALDYGIPEVRAHAMKLVQELIDRYDADGLELDWMRFGYHFKPGQEEEGREILTQFMAEVRSLLNRKSTERGHPILLGARVPSHPDAAAGLGMDGVRWVREGLVDLLVPTPFWATSDFDIPMELWRERIGPAGHAILAAGLEILVRASPDAPATTNDLESVRGFALSAYYRGADRIYLFNYLDPAPMTGGVEAYRELLEQGLSPARLARQPRRHIVTYRDTVPGGMSNGAVLPADAVQGVTFRLHIGPKPSKGKAHLIVGMRQGKGVSEAHLSAGAGDRSLDSSNEHPAPSRYPGVARALVFDVPLETLQDGYNTFTVRQSEGEPSQTIVWCELRLE